MGTHRAAEQQSSRDSFSSQLTTHSLINIPT